MDLKDRVKTFLNELGVPATAFSKRVEISVTSYNKWMNGSLNLSEQTQQRISDYLEKYNF